MFLQISRSATLTTKLAYLYFHSIHSSIYYFLLTTISRYRFVTPSSSTKMRSGLGPPTYSYSSFNFSKGLLLLRGFFDAALSCFHALLNRLESEALLAFLRSPFRVPSSIEIQDFLARIENASSRLLVPNQYTIWGTLELSHFEIWFKNETVSILFLSTKHFIILIYTTYTNKITYRFKCSQPLITNKSRGNIVWS
jgi:hypothetical protein